MTGPQHSHTHELALHNLPVEIIAQIARLLDFQSIVGLLKAEPLLSRHFIAVSNYVDDGGCVEYGNGLVPGRPTLSLDAFLGSGSSTDHFLRLFVLTSRGNAYDRIIGWRSGVIPPEDRFFHAMLINWDSFVFLGRDFCQARYTLASEQLSSQGVSVSRSTTYRHYHYPSWESISGMMSPHPYKRSSTALGNSLNTVTELRLHAHVLSPNGQFVVTGVHVPALERLFVFYQDYIPLFLPGNTLGTPLPSHCRERTGITELLFIHAGSDNATQTELSTIACYSSPDDLSQSDWSFTSNFERLSVIGGPNSLIKHIDLSNTISLLWKRASRQTLEDYDNFPTEIVAPYLAHFSFETLITNTVIPKINSGVINQFSRLCSVIITTRRPGLQLNNILRDHGSMCSVCLFNKVVPRSHQIASSQRSRKRRRTPETPITLVQELRKSELAQEYPFMTRFELHGPFKVDFDIRDLLGMIQTGAVTYFPQTEDTGLRRAKRMKMLEGVAPWTALG